MKGSSGASPGRSLTPGGHVAAGFSSFGMGMLRGVHAPRTSLAAGVRDIIRRAMPEIARRGSSETLLTEYLLLKEALDLALLFTASFLAYFVDAPASWSALIRQLCEAPAPTTWDDAARARRASLVGWRTSRPAFVDLRRGRASSPTSTRRVSRW